jgi:hypothetical protein
MLGIRSMTADERDAISRWPLFTFRSGLAIAKEANPE